MLSADAQIRYMIQWFQEWSDLQKSDFLPIMAERYANRVFVNGIVNSLANVECRDKPMSLFECRVKLFKEWFIQWSVDQKDYFFKQITELDSTFAEKLNSELNNGAVAMVNGNGDLDGEVIDD
ncbi:uncharacterized protein C14orf119 [Harmonia axyridis]|uniref:uncharacterized protein C14orf119 n=1 Tax=Harmonia axyridis TaxID=115357 RepID=UPI001E276EAC|nr:uncharacterized protein C14orf119 [Harmonia axyridis]XP_045471138.1 uncharacterized protein C14orf119 [Harmonia axyridis]XP_045471150.1 uncharacterized protein C14orf119 [Harmonia axyridis]XP_045471161.1 uncharacterized protein C14orf119 [Harmonia axyridis]